MMNRKLHIYFLLSYLFFSNFLYAQKFVGEAKEDRFLREAIKKEMKTAKNGDAESQYVIGMHYLKGIMLEKDVSLALWWLRKSKNNNYAKALEFFGDIEDNDSIAETYYLQAILNFNEHDRFPVSMEDIRYKISHLTKNKRLLYLDIAAKYLMGEYKYCSNMGDSIDEVEDIFDAMILSYSSMANHKLAFEERKIDHSDNVYLPNFHRANYKARMALEFLNNSIDDGVLSNKELFVDKLQSYSLAISCSKILQIPQYKLFLNHIHTKIYPIKAELASDMVYQQLELDFYEIIYHLEKGNFTFVFEKLLPEFESYITKLRNVDSITLSQTAMLYGKLSEFLNYFAIEQGKEHPELALGALNTMIHCRDYEFYSKSKNNGASFNLIDWSQIKSSMPENSVALLFFEYARSTDSWNYVWSFSPDSSIPDVKYGGHSYWSESQGMWAIQGYENVTRLYVVGTNSMMLTDYSNDSRVIRLHSISEILNQSQKHHYTNEQVFVIGKINYSKKNIYETSESKGAVHTVGTFSSAEKEVQSIKSSFGDKVNLYQGNDVSKDVFQRISKQSGILHISTHGIFNRSLLDTYNKNNPLAGITGENILRSCGLMLSGYNDDRINNFISAHEISKLSFNDIDLVFISACESGAGKVLDTGDYSLAEAFHLSGVHNIIAIIDPINEAVATNFAEVFYKKISKGMSYHKAFYEAKGKICPYDRIILFE